jgi:LAO/AO transport system kinase
VVNKADRPGAARLARELERSLALVEAPWTPPVLTASATEGRGVDEAERAVTDHLAWCVGEGRASWDRRRGDARVRLFLDLVAEGARSRAAALLGDGDLERDLRAGRLSPHEALGRMRGAG